MAIAWPSLSLDAFTQLSIYTKNGKYRTMDTVQSLQSRIVNMFRVDLGRQLMTSIFNIEVNS